MRQPDFNQLLAVLNRERPDRPTLFEFFLNARLYQKLSGSVQTAPWGTPAWNETLIPAFAQAGYDYATVGASRFHFEAKPVERQASRSMSDSAIIVDRKSFDAFDWPNPDDYPLQLSQCEPYLAEGQKLIVSGPGGVMENVMSLVGYEPLCYMMIDDPDLVQVIFDAVGSRMLRYYEMAATHPLVGALIVNDDWGFNTQTMLAPEDMRRYVFPWHRRIVEVIHHAGKPAILHSCGQLACVMDDIIEDMRYDAKHSYEDKIMPVEDAYQLYGRRIAIVGGMDLDFVCRSTPEQITARGKAMLERARERGGYALGTGNSVPEYVPNENYLAMISAALDGETAALLAARIAE